MSVKILNQCHSCFKSSFLCSKMPKILRNCSNLEGFFKKKIISLIVRMRTSRGSTVIRMTCCFYISCSNASDTAFTIDHLWTFASKMPLKTVIFHHFWMWIWHSNTILLAFILLKNFPSKYTRALGILTRYFCLVHKWSHHLN